MLLLVLILVLIAFGLLVVALLTGSVLWAWVSVGVSVAAAAVLLIDWLQRRSALKAGAEPLAAPEPGRGPGTVMDYEPITERIALLPQIAPPGPGPGPGAGERHPGGPPAGPPAPASTPVAAQLDGSPDAQQTMWIPAVQPPGSGLRPPGAEPGVIPSGGLSSPTVVTAAPDPLPATGDPTTLPAALEKRSTAAPAQVPSDLIPPGPTPSGPVPDSGESDATTHSGVASEPPAAGTQRSGGPVQSPPGQDPGSDATAVVASGSPDTGPPDRSADSTVVVDRAAMTAAKAMSVDAPATSAGSAAGGKSDRPTEGPPGSGAATVVNKLEPREPGPSGQTLPEPAALFDLPGRNAPGAGDHAGTRDSVPEQPAGDVLDGEAPEEPLDMSAAALVASLDDEVLVIDEQPRYHLTGCRALVGAEQIPLPAREAVDFGFTPCGWCTPDRTLAGRHPATAR